MNEALSYAADLDTWRAVLLSILVAYVLSQAIAGVYVWTHRGMSYSRSFVIALVVSGLVSTVLMQAIGNSLARGIGIVGTLALIRFRTTLNDPLDMLFVFAAFGAGIAAGTANFATAVIGTVAFLVVVTLLQFTGFGEKEKPDGVLRVLLPSASESENALVSALRTHCRQFAAITIREAAQGRELERVYQVTLREPGHEGALVAAVAAVPGATGVSVAMQGATLDL